jgi:transposase-like protein
MSRSNRWVQLFSPRLIDAARPFRRVSSDRWFVDETYVKVAERLVCLYGAIDQFDRVWCMSGRHDKHDAVDARLDGAGEFSKDGPGADVVD